MIYPEFKLRKCYSPRHICWDKCWKNCEKHDSFIARAIRTLFYATFVGGGGGGGENILMIKQLNENLSLSVPTNYDVDCS